MARLIYVEASPRKERSASRMVALAFAEAYRAGHPEDDVETLDLWSLDLPEFDGATIDAKYRIMHGEEHTPAEAAAWRRVVEVFEQFAAGDKYLFSLPMWNFGIPYKLKQFIDVITQPGLAFSVGPDGYEGLLRDRPAVVVYARGGRYSDPEQKALDHQRSYMELFLGFIGFTDVRPVLIEPTLGPPDVVERAKASARERAIEIAGDF